MQRQYSSFFHLKPFATNRKRHHVQWQNRSQSRPTSLRVHTYICVRACARIRLHACVRAFYALDLWQRTSWMKDISKVLNSELGESFQRRWVAREWDRLCLKNALTWLKTSWRHTKLKKKKREWEEKLRKKTEKKKKKRKKKLLLFKKKKKINLEERIADLRDQNSCDATGRAAANGKRFFFVQLINNHS